MPPTDHRITDALKEWGRKGRAGLDKVIDLTYPDLRKLARHALKGDNPQAGRSSGDLTSSLFLVLRDLKKSTWENRRRFFAFAKLKFHHIIQNEIRWDKREIRGGNFQHTDDSNLTNVQQVDPKFEERELALLLQTIKDQHPQVYEMLILKHQGWTDAEIAKQLGKSTATVKRDWRKARNLLAVILELEQGGHP